MAIVLSFSFPINSLAGTNVYENTPALETTIDPTSSFYDELTGELYFTDVKYHMIRKVLPNNQIVSVAGRGIPAYSGDNGLALSAALNYPTSVFVSAKREIYICDYGNNRVRKIFTNGTIVTIAGKQQIFGCLSGGDGAKATATGICNPHSIYVTAQDEIFFTETSHGRVRKIDINGTITTFAGLNPLSSGYSGDGGPANQARLNYPRGIAMSSDGSLFIADSSNDCIRKVFPNGTITTIAGKGTSQLNGVPALNAKLRYPVSVSINSQNHLYIVEQLSFTFVGIKVRKIVDGIIYAVAGGDISGVPEEGAVATSALLTDVQHVLALPQGKIIISDLGKLRQVDTLGIITSFAGFLAGTNDDGILATLPPVPAYDVKFSPSGELHMAEYSTHRIRKLIGNKLYNVVGINNLGGSSLDGAFANVSRIFFPTSIAFSPQGELHFVENQAVRKVRFNGTLQTVAGISGINGFNGDGIAATSALLANPEGITFWNNELYICDSQNHRVRRILSNGTITTVVGSGIVGFTDFVDATNANLNFPTSIDFDVNGNFYIADSQNNRLRKVYSNGMIGTVYQHQSRIMNVRVDSVGGVFFTADSRVYRLDLNNQVIVVAGSANTGFRGDGQAATQAVMYNPRGIEFDNAGNIIIADSKNEVVRSFKHCLNDIVVNGVCTSCGAGKIANITENSCVDCSQGSILTGGVCKLCPPGTAPNAQKTQCISCGTNQVAAEGASSCSFCPLGKIPSLFQSGCISCPTSYYATASYQCVACGAGQTNNYEGTGCISCNNGWYSSTSGTACVACPRGSSNNAQYTGCQQCSAGYYNSAAGSACVACSAGSTNDTLNYACQNCPANYASSAGSACYPCLAGTQSDTFRRNCVSCSVGYYSPGLSACIACGVGYSSSANKTSCVRCNHGFYASFSGSACNACPAGRTNNTANSACINCVEGYFSTGSGSACLGCAAGQTSNAAKTGCVSCPSGNFSTGGTPCMSCPFGLVPTPSKDSCEVPRNYSIPINPGTDIINKSSTLKFVVSLVAIVFFAMINL